MRLAGAVLSCLLAPSFAMAEPAKRPAPAKQEAAKAKKQAKPDTKAATDAIAASYTAIPLAERIAAGDDVARPDRDAARIFDLAPRRWRSTCRKGRIGARHGDHHRLHDAGHRLIVLNREAAHLFAARLSAHVKFLQVLQAGNDEEIRAQHAVLGFAARGLLLHALEHGGQCRAGLRDAEGFDRNLAARRSPARAAGDRA